MNIANVGTKSDSSEVRLRLHRCLSGHERHSILAQQSKTRDDELAITTARCLILDSIQSAGGGHVGAAVALVPAAYTLWTSFLRFDPADPSWAVRDRVVLSNGHACALQYVVLHLTGYNLTLHDLASLRDAGSRTPGHPEYGRTPGIEATTGPLGQGVANAVGMALADRLQDLRDRVPNPSRRRVWVFAGDGCLMEGVSSEASSLAGHWNLGNLALIYDDNGITIDAPTSATFSESVRDRYRSYGWNVITVEDGNDREALSEAYAQAMASHDAPTFIDVKTRVAYGLPGLEGTTAAHGGPLPDGLVERAKQSYRWPYPEPFTVPDVAYSAWRSQARQRDALPAAPHDPLPRQPSSTSLPWEAALDELELPPRPVSTRDMSNTVLARLAVVFPDLIGGAADVAGLGYLQGGGDFTGGSFGRNIFFGVREHAMGAIANGLALDGRSRVFVTTFLAFSDYLRPSIRLTALMGLPVIFVFSHDSVAVGGDGPTHQPVEQLSSLRAMPNLYVIRPADPSETVEAWRLALQRNTGPPRSILSRQALDITPRPARARLGVRRGAYVISPEGGVRPDLVLIATGSEVALALDAQRQLEQDTRLSVRVVSMPCIEAFEDQPREYRDEVLPPTVRARLAIEAGATQGWWKWTGPSGGVVGVDRFGACARDLETWREYGFNCENVVSHARRIAEAVQAPGCV